jgi:Ca-activated chloride channel family protein
MNVKRTPRVEVVTQKPVISAGRAQSIDVLIRVIPPQIEQITQRPHLNLALVLDRSGSMDGEKMVRAREAASFCIDQLQSTDRISLVVFDDVVEVLVEGQRAENRDAIKERISTIFARNSTALHQAWVKGGIEVSKDLGDGINRVLLITDGLANVGVTNVDTIVSQAGELAARGVSTSTIGIGNSFNEDLLIPMAEAGRGNAWHVEKASEMERIFSTELQSLIAQFAHTVSLGVTPSDGVKVQDLVNDFEVTNSGRYKLPNLRAGSPLDMIIRVQVPAGSIGQRLKVLDLRLAWNPQGAPSSDREILNHPVFVEYGSSEEVDRLPEDEQVTKAVHLLMGARARREAIEHLDRGDVLGARAAVGDSARLLAEVCGSYIGDESISAELQMLMDLDRDLASGHDLKMSRKKMGYQSYQARSSKPIK